MFTLRKPSAPARAAMRVAHSGEAALTEITRRTRRGVDQELKRIERSATRARKGVDAAVLKVDGAVGKARVRVENASLGSLVTTAKGVVRSYPLASVAVVLAASALMARKI